MTKQERATRTRNALIRSAAELFDRRGYVQARLAEISSGAGVSAGALHFHFENKAAVAEAVEAAAAEALRRAALRARTRPEASGSPEHPPGALQALADTTHVLARLLRRDIVVHAGFQLSRDPARSERLDLLKEWHGCVRQLLSQAAAEGQLSRDVPLERLASTIVAATMGLEILGREDREWLSRRSLAGFWQLLLPRVTVTQSLAGLDPRGTDSAFAEAAGTP